MEISEKIPLHPKDSFAQFFSPFVIIVGIMSLLTAFFHGVAGENPIGPVTWFVSESWAELSPLVLFLAAVWGFHLASYLLVGAFLQDLLMVAWVATWVACTFWRRFLSCWTAPSLVHYLTLPLSLVRLFPRCLLSWLATGWRAGDSVQLE